MQSSIWKGTTRAQLDRLLDPDNPSATLATLVKAANAVGARDDRARRS
jgi:hypothetical protein